MTCEAPDGAYTKGGPPAKRILVVTNYYPPFMVGGAEVVAHRQVAMLRKRGWEVAVFAGRAADNLGDVGTFTVEDHEGVPVYRLSHIWMDPGKNFRNKFADKVFAGLLHTYKPDWVHFHNLIGLGTDLIILAKRYGVQTALTLHDYWGICYRGILLRRDWSLCDNADMCGYCCEANVKTSDGADVPMRLRRDYVAWCLEQADRILSPSQSLAENYKKLGFQKPIVPFTNGIDLRTIPSRVRNPGEKVRFVAASYLGEHKGIPELIAALRILSKKPELNGRWEFTLAGAGHIEQQVLMLAADLPGSFRFLGRLSRHEMLLKLHDADVVVLASIWPENEPVSLLEAIASGAAIVATRIGGNIEIVGDERSGMICEPRNSQALAEAFEQLILEPTIINQMSKHNIQRANQFDEERTGDFLERVYSETTAPWKSSDRVIICGGGVPDANSRHIIDALAFLGTSGRIRLLWLDWIGDHAWGVAAGFWWWDERCDVGELQPALSRGIPVCVRNSGDAKRIAHHLPVTTYKDEPGFMSWIDHVSQSSPMESQFVDIPLLRQNNSLRPSSDFYLPC